MNELENKHQIQIILDPNIEFQCSEIPAAKNATQGFMGVRACVRTHTKHKVLSSHKTFMLSADAPQSQY